MRECIHPVLWGIDSRSTSLLTEKLLMFCVKNYSQNLFQEKLENLTFAQITRVYYNQNFCTSRFTLQRHKEMRLSTNVGQKH